MCIESMSNTLSEWFAHNKEGDPPAEFNPAARPYARIDAVIRSMLEDNYYGPHTRIECAAEFQRRYHESLRKDGQPIPVTRCLSTTC